MNIERSTLNVRRPRCPTLVDISSSLSSAVPLPTTPLSTVPLRKAATVSETFGFSNSSHPQGLTSASPHPHSFILWGFYTLLPMDPNMKSHIISLHFKVAGRPVMPQTTITQGTRRLSPKEAATILLPSSMPGEPNHSRADTMTRIF